MPGVSEVHIGRYLGMTMLTIRASSRIATACQIRQWLAEHGGHLQDVVREFEFAPDFSGPARLVPLSPRLAALAMLRRLQGPLSVCGPEEPGLAKRTFIEMLRLIGNAKCYELYVGPLGQMADLALSTIS